MFVSFMLNDLIYIIDDFSYLTISKLVECKSQLSSPSVSKLHEEGYIFIKEN